MQRITTLALAGLVAGSFAVSSANAMSVSGTESGTVTSPGGSEVYTGSSGLSTLGTILLYSASDTVSGTSVTSGLFTQDYATGDLTGTYTGTFQTDGSTDAETLTFTVTGGTSAFAGATGSFTGLENITLAAPDTFVLNFVGSVTEVSSTPLPSTWAMMLAGLAAVGFFAARKKSGFAAAA